MNRYGRMAQEHWRRWLPTRYREIPDPSNFFTTLGQQVEERIVTLSVDIAGDDPPGEGYLDKVGRLNMARLQAEEIVLAEQVLLPAEPQVDPDEEDHQRAAQRGSGADWIPVREDPAHPFWIEDREHNP
jgi:hypothetical protein